MDNSLLSYSEKVDDLKSTKNFMLNPLAYANRVVRGGEEDYWRWNRDFTFLFPAYRSIKGNNHTFYVMDIDVKMPQRRQWVEDNPILVEKTQEFVDLFIEQEQRKIFLEVSTRVGNEILDIDSDFFAYYSGKGLYLTRVVPFSVDPSKIFNHVSSLVKPCSADCRKVDHHFEWHYTSNSATPSISRIVPYTYEDDTYYLQITIDGKMYGNAKQNVFRVPYSLYVKYKSDIFVCAPVVRNGKYIDFEASYPRTIFRDSVVEEYEVPNFEALPKSNYKPSSEELKSIDVETKNIKYYSHQERRIGDLNYENDLPLHIREKVDRMHYLVSHEDHVVTPPCILVAYNRMMYGDGLEAHLSRVTVGRYLKSISLKKGDDEGYQFSNTDICHFFIHVVNDFEDNLPVNRPKLITNMQYYIIPTYIGEHHTATCSTHQDERNAYFCCTSVEKKRCGGRIRATYDVVLKLPVEEEVKEEEVVSDDYMRTVNKVIDIMNDDQNIIIKKTTRAGLTTSSVVANQHLTNKRLLLVVPTVSIAQKTFPEAVDIVKEYTNVPPVLGGVFTSNVQGCIRLNVLNAQHEKDWKNKDQTSILSQLPFMIKPTCKGCHFSNKKFDVREDLIIHSKISPELYKLDVESSEHAELGICAKYSLSNEIPKINVGVITYAKLIAIITSDTEENEELLRQIYQFNCILFDESSHLLGLNQHSFLLKHIRFNSSKTYTSLITEQLAILKNKINEDRIEKDEQILKRDLENVIFNSLKGVELLFSRSLIRLEKGEIQIAMDNPLIPADRKAIFLLYRIIQNYISRDNVDLILLAKLVLTCQTDEWYFDKVVNKDGTQTQYQMHTSPESSAIKKFIVNVDRKEHMQILLTDATPSSMPMDKFLGVEFKDVVFGDPRGIDKKSLIIPDNRMETITSLTENRDGVPLSRLSKFIEDCKNEFGAKNIFIIFPNQETLRIYKGLYVLDERLKVTYYRSKETVGVSSERRIMISIARPLPPTDSLRYQAHFFVKYYQQKIPDIDFDQVQQILVQESANQSLYQGIGRVKCPRGVENSTVFLYGIKKEDARDIVETYSNNYSYVEERSTMPITHYVPTVKKWREEGIILSVLFFDTISHIIQGTKAGIEVDRLRKSDMVDHEVNYLLKDEVMDRYGLFYDVVNNAITPR